jgi:SAM-dependent methyltransferase
MSEKVITPNDYENYFESRNWTNTNSAENFWYYDQLQIQVGLPRGSRVLEIGFGDARFLDWCQSRGLVPVGVEILDVALQKARRLGHEVFLGPFSRSTLPVDRQFDIIAAFDVVEHLTVHEIRQLFRDTLPHLAPDGKYILRFPNGNSPFVGAIQTGDITHRTLVSPGTIEDVVRPLGLSVTRSLNDRMLPQGALPRVKRLLSYTLRSVIETVIGFAFFGQRLPMDPNIFVVVKRST